MARAIRKEQWESYCAWLSKALEGGVAEIEVSSPNLGHQVQSDWRPLIGITYDPKVLSVSAADITLGSIEGLSSGWQLCRKQRVEAGDEVAQKQCRAE